MCGKSHDSVTFFHFLNWSVNVLMCGLELKWPYCCWSGKSKSGFNYTEGERCIFWSDKLSLQRMQRRRPLLRILMHSLWSVQLRRRRWVVLSKQYTQSQKFHLTHLCNLWKLITVLILLYINQLFEPFLIWSNVWNMFYIFFFIRKKWRQKSRRLRKMEIQKRQKWRLRSLPCYLFAALSYQPGQHRVVELVLSVSLKDNSFCLLPCYHIALESWNIVALPPFFTKCYLLVFKMSFFSTCTNWATLWDQFFHFLRFYISMLEAQSLLCQCWPDDSYIQAAAHLQGSCWSLRFT